MEDLQIFIAILVCGTVLLIGLLVYTYLNRKGEMKNLQDMTHQRLEMVDPIEQIEQIL